jgi:predicted DNA-binding protein (MmcQ/YjbR family)
MAASRRRATPEDALLAIALSYPEAVEDFPWGERALKVRKKIFLFLSRHVEGEFRLSMKLPHSAHEALALPFAEPTHYGMGKHGWVTLIFPDGTDVPVDLIAEWIDESYRAIAPKASGRGAGWRGSREPGAGARRRRSAKKARAKNAHAKKPAVRKKASNEASKARTTKRGARKAGSTTTAKKTPTAKKPPTAGATTKAEVPAKKPPRTRKAK